MELFDDNFEIFNRFENDLKIEDDVSTCLLYEK